MEYSRQLAEAEIYVRLLFDNICSIRKDNRFYYSRVVLRLKRSYQDHAPSRGHFVKIHENRFISPFFQVRWKAFPGINEGVHL